MIQILIANHVRGIYVVEYYDVIVEHLLVLVGAEVFGIQIVLAYVML
jgi:hypothetical protein